MKFHHGLFVTLIAAWLTSGCSDKRVGTQPTPVASEAPAAPSVASPPDESVAAPQPSVPTRVAFEIPAGSTKIFNERCVLCHGKSGKGDGIGATGMKPPPRNWTDTGWQAAVTDEHIATTIVKGGAGVGKSSTMPASPDLDGNFKRDIVDGLVHIVRSFNEPPVPL